MLEQKIYDTYTELLHSELITAMGCTEPIAIAYAGALARRVLGQEPEHLHLACSGNIVKNVKGVTVPNSGGRRGIEIAALLGVCGGDAQRRLAVLESVTDETRARAVELLEAGICETSLIEGTDNLVVQVTARAGGDEAFVEIRTTHTNVTRMERNGENLLEGEQAQEVCAPAPDKKLLNVRDILTYGKTVDLARVRDVLENQIQCNRTISQTGLAGHYGAEVGATLRSMFHEGPFEMRAAAAAAAGSDARMNGCPLPVVINSGSGNQGLTVTMPVLLYAEENGVDHEKLLRALAIANLMSIHQKRFIGSLSAYCGATSAACAASVGVCWMQGGSYEQICGVITNTLATLGGMWCDGAKSSCASKIAAAVYTGLLSVRMSMNGHHFEQGEGIVTESVEKTIEDVGYIAREGMKETDLEILRLMLKN